VLSVIKAIDRDVAASAMQTYHLLEEAGDGVREPTSQLSSSPSKAGMHVIDGERWDQIHAATRLDSDWRCHIKRLRLLTLPRWCEYP
jgi:hypothetical protein